MGVLHAGPTLYIQKIVLFPLVVTAPILVYYLEELLDLFGQFNAKIFQFLTHTYLTLSDVLQLIYYLHRLGHKNISTHLKPYYSETIGCINFYLVSFLRKHCSLLLDKVLF